MTLDSRPQLKPECENGGQNGNSTVTDIGIGRRALSQLDPALDRLNALLPIFAWRANPPGFASLARIIVGQHVSTLSADAVWKRVAEKTGGVTVASVMEADIVRLGELGLTRAKSRSIVAIAKAIDAGSFDLQCLRHMTDFEASACLKSLPGVGTWTADVYLMTCEGRQDIFPAGDIALREAVRLMDRTSLRLSADELTIRSQQWRPFRGVAAHMLWAYYKLTTGRIGA